MQLEPSKREIIMLCGYWDNDGWYCVALTMHYVDLISFRIDSKPSHIA